MSVPSKRTARPTPEDCLTGGGEMGSLMRAFDWSKSPLGPVESWPQSLQTAVSICLGSRFPIVLWWGPELRLLYNDAWRPVLGQTKHPQALGSPGRDIWPEIWHIIGPMLESVLATGQATWSDDQLLPLDRNGYLEEAYFTYSYSPIRDEGGAVGGVFSAVNETTTRVIGERRLQTLRDLGAQATQAKTTEEACRIAVETLAENTHDIPFALLYMKSEDGTSARLFEFSQLQPGTEASPLTIDFSQDDPGGWPVDEAIRTGRPVQLPDVRARFGDLPGGVWDLPPEEAMVLPIRESETRLSGALVLGVSPCRKFDGDYRTFFELAVRQISTTIGNARAYEEEKRRAEALAELDRAKTTFFSNVSHEFRTPLTLLLGPVEDMLAKPESGVLPENRELLGIVRRNALRLQKLVNTLLDFSRIEAGRVQASYEPTDLASLTTELASVFRSAVEKAGMRLIVDCDSLPEPPYVDRDMWEKIILNLMSNAFKFTLEGEIEVSLRQEGDSAILRVRDTGTGIPEEELPHIFERFHRVEGTRARTHEGTGIGLALVQELVRLHGGTVAVDSIYGRGTTFTVRIPLGTAHLPADRIGSGSSLESTALGAQHFVSEALKWVGVAEDADSSARFEESGGEEVLAGAGGPDGERPRILIADDNADLRQYLTRLLGNRYQVEAVADGEAAVAAARARRPDLVLTDVMMPKLDGFGLLRELRSDPATRTIPAIMLSARAGEEARIEGLEAGVDDYLIKPFSARELLARVTSQLELARVRREVAAANERAATILESITDGFISLDREWRFTHVNAEAERINGTSRRELLGRNHWEVFPDTVGTVVEREFRRAVAEQVRVEFENYYEPWGRWFEVNAYPSSDGGLSVYFRDITDRRRLERQLRDFVENATIGLHWVGPDGTILWANKAEVELLGYTPEEYIGQHIAEFHADSDVIEDILCRLTNNEELHSYEARLRAKDGSIKHVLISSNVYREGGEFRHTRCFTRDITERRLAEEEARKRLASWKVTLASVGDGVIVSDAVGKVTFMNAVAQTLCGWAEEEALGKALDEVFSTVNEETRAPVESPVARVIREGAVVGLANHTVLVAKGGTERPIDDSAAPIRDDAGNVTGVVLVFHDISERRRAERHASAQHSTARILADSTTVDEATAHVLEAVCTHLAWDLGAAWMVDRRANVLRPIAVWHAPSAPFPDFEEETKSRCFDPGVGLPGRVWATAQPVWLENATDDENFPRASVASRSGLHGAFGIPILRDGDVLGVLEFFCRTCRPTETDLLESMGTIARQLGQFIERRQAEHELRDSEALKSAILETALDCIITIDEQSRVIDWNPATEKTFGYSRADAIGRPMAELIVPSHLREPHYRGMARYLETGEGLLLGKRVELTAMRSGGAEFPVELAITAVQIGDDRLFTAYLADITDRKRAEAELRESEDRFRTLVMASSNVVYRMSPDWSEMWHLEGRKFIPDTLQPSRTWLEKYIHPDDQPQVLAAINDSIRTRSIFELEHRVIRVDGSLGWTHSRAIPRLNESGEIIEWFGMASDVTPRKEAEAERERLLKAAQDARQEAETANRMKDEFLATLSHELRTPLNAIVGWARILRSGKIDEEDLKEGIEVIERNSKAQAQLIEDLLDVSRIISGKMTLDVQRVNVQDVIDAAVTAVLPAAEAKGVRIQKVLDSLAAPVAGDPTRIQQIVWNLLSNAVKFTPKGGKVQVLLERVNSHVEISVIDTGIGINPEFLPYVFERFRQADGSTTRRHGGLGLGLAIVKQLTEMHGGTVRAKSPGEGQGATFTVTLPITIVHPEKVPPKEPEQKDVTCEDGLLAGVRVLIVDDEHDARQLIKRILAECQAEVSLAGSADEAIQLLSTFDPDVLLSDVGMPGKDGYDLIREIRERLTARELPAAALTAFARSEDRRRAMMAGFQTHVAKPVDPDELVAVVASLAGRTGRR